MFELKIRQDEVVKDMFFTVIDGEYVTLSGSEKQIAWAEKIRSTYVADNCNKLDRLIDLHRNMVNSKDLADTLKAIENIVNQNSEAKFWIENKNRLQALTGAECRKIKEA